MLEKKKKKRENGAGKVHAFAKKMRKKPPKSEESLKGITEVSVYLLHRFKDRCYRVQWSIRKCVLFFLDPPVLIIKVLFIFTL